MQLPKKGLGLFGIICTELYQMHNPMSKEQWLRFARAAVKRYPKSKVRETKVRR